MWLTAISISIYWHRLLFSTEKVINFIRNPNTIGQLIPKFHQEMEAECAILYLHTRVFWFSTGQILQRLINLHADISLSLSLFCDREKER